MYSRVLDCTGSLRTEWGEASYFHSKERNNLLSYLFMSQYTHAEV